MNHHRKHVNQMIITDESTLKAQEHAFGGGLMNEKVKLLWQPQGPIALQWKSASHHRNSFAFDQVFVKFTYK